MIMMKHVLCLLLIFLAAQLVSAPKLVAEAEINQPELFLTRLSEFVSRIDPENAGNFILLSAMFAMRPGESPLNMDQPVRCALILPSPEENAVPLLSLSLKPEKIPVNRRIPFMGISWNIIREKNGKALLSPENIPLKTDRKLLDPLWERKTAFRKKIPGIMLELHQPAMNYSVQILQTVLTEKAIASILSDAGNELENLTLKLTFPSAGKLSFSGYAKLRNNTPPQNSLSAFTGSHSFRNADRFMTAMIPNSIGLKRRIISAADRMGTPYLIQQCIMRSNGIIASAWTARNDICKLTIGLEKGSATILENLLKEERGILRLSSGILKISPGLYLRLKDDKAVFASGVSSDADALKIIKDESPIPFAPRPYLNGGVINGAGKPVQRFFIKPDPNGNIRFELDLKAEDFPKRETGMR